MRKSITMKAGAVGTAFALAGGLALIASGTTGAYFSDTKTGVIKGNTGSIQISTTNSDGTGSNKLDFTFANLMPGEAQTATVQYTNTGKKAQDVWLTFPNVPALHALNNLGSYGEVKVVGGTGAGAVTLFVSANLNDGRTRADGTNSCGPFSATLPGCWPLPDKLLVASDVAPLATGQVTFSFNYASKLSGTGVRPDGSAGVFNSYPLATQAFGDDAAGPSGDGLPVTVVAVQVGKTP